ncbi:MAG: response regulator [Leptolyngbya sp. SIOISBB]|nr:response regulator [Leptolyngbya sp. SIOISBB]
MANLLIVDDDSTIRTFLALALKADGHNILEAESGEACEFLVHRQKLDMILLDAQMPVMDGFTCCAHLKTTFWKPLSTYHYDYGVN